MHNQLNGFTGNTLPPTLSTTGNVSKITVQSSLVVNMWGKVRGAFPVAWQSINIMSMSDNQEQPSGRHFNSGSHSVADLKGCILESVKSRDKYVLHMRERFYIQKFDTFRNGLNQEQ